MQVTINGKKCVLPDGASVDDVRKGMASVLGRDQLVEEDGRGGKILQGHERLREGQKVWSIPQIVKGVSDDRLAAEIALLREAAGRRSEIVRGTKTIGGCRYTAVLVKKVRVDEHKFDVTFTDLLFLLPPQYPALPPIGCYLNYKWQTSDRHFILGNAHGAPSLVNEGWYWYCVGLGGGFEAGGLTRCWRPGARPDHGHNLATLFVAAPHPINTSDA
jgi:hypothetical protein